MHPEDNTISETIAHYERLRAFVDERISEQMPDDVDIPNEVRDALSGMDMSEHIDLDDLDLDSKVEDGVENYMSYNMDIDDMLAHADPDSFVQRVDMTPIITEILPDLLENPEVVHMIRTALAEVPAPEEVKA